MERLETVSAPPGLAINGFHDIPEPLAEEGLASISGNGVDPRPSPSFSRRLAGLRGQLSSEGWRNLQRLSKNLSLENLDESGEGLLNRQHRINSADCMDPEFAACQPHTALGRAIKAVEETFLLARLTIQLSSYLGLGWRWFYKFIRLCMYSTLLMPGFLQMMVFYFFSHRVIRSIPYGHKARNRLDMFVPPGHWNMEHGLRPVVIYITGGAWTIGYKAWGSLLGRRLSKNGVMVVCLDYRNFPQGTGLDMLEDINTGISWVMRKIMYYGGDPEQVYLVGQSCGAQLGMMALITQAEQEAHGKRLPGGSPSWSPARIQGVVGVSGVYNCFDLAEHFHATGLYHTIFDRIMSIDGKPELKLMSPTYCVKGVSWGGALPRVMLLHGTKDICALVSNAVQFKNALQDAGAKVELRLYEDQTHTSPLIENPMRGGRDKLMDDILSFVQGRDIQTRNSMLCPALLIDLAAKVCPF